MVVERKDREKGGFCQMPCIDKETALASASLRGDAN